MTVHVSMYEIFVNQCYKYKGKTQQGLNKMK